jgi:chromosomal replication initiator protein
MSTEHLCCPTIDAIQRAVAAEFRIPLFELLSERRHRAAARPRQVAVWLCRHLTPHSLSAIGRMFHRDHTTIIQSVGSVTKMMRNDPELSARVWRLVGELAPGLAVDLRRSTLRRVVA